MDRRYHHSAPSLVHLPAIVLRLKSLYEELHSGGPDSDDPTSAGLKPRISAVGILMALSLSALQQKQRHVTQQTSPHEQVGNPALYTHEQQRDRQTDREKGCKVVC